VLMLKALQNQRAVMKPVIQRSLQMQVHKTVKMNVLTFLREIAPSGYRGCGIPRFHLSPGIINFTTKYASYCILIVSFALFIIIKRT